MVWPKDNIPEIHDLHVAAWIKEYLKPGEVFYDIGANRGIFSLQAALIGADVYAFECVPNTLAMIPPHPNITYIPLAVWSHKALLDVWLSIGTGQVEVYPIGWVPREQELVTKLVVPAMSLMEIVEYLPKPQMIKADIQGAELKMLDGADLALRRVHTMIIEVEEGCLARQGATFADVEATLRDLGFVIVDRVHNDILVRV